MHDSKEVCDNLEFKVKGIELFQHLHIMGSIWHIFEKENIKPYIADYMQCGIVSASICREIGPCRVVHSTFLHCSYLLLDLPFFVRCCTA